MRPAIDIVKAALTFLFMIRVSISSPTKKRKKTRPIVEVRVSIGIDVGGNIVLVNLGMRPMILGPKMTPPMTSAMTFGCLMRPRIRPRSCVKRMIITISRVRVRLLRIVQLLTDLDNP